MSTVAQLALAKGFAALKSVHGSAWTFGAAEFLGVASALRPDDPRLSGAADRLIEVQVLTADMPATYPKRGNSVTHAGRTHSVVRVDDDLSSGITTILITA